MIRQMLNWNTDVVLAYNVLWLYFSCKVRKRVFSDTNKRLAKNNFDFSRYFSIE